MDNEFIRKVAQIQQNLKAPKSQYNKFGKYYYRNCEDILEALKPVLGDMVVTLCDELILIGDRYYIKATATITDGKISLSNSAFARESLTKKGMDESQITGTASSYSRKYALNGLFGIDDTKDSDSVNENGNTGYSYDEIAKGWVEACKQDANRLNEINDESYREYIKGLL